MTYFPEREREERKGRGMRDTPFKGGGKKFF
jgi:hypothetical protein